MDQAIRISDFESSSQVDYGNDVVALVTGAGGTDADGNTIYAQTMRSVVGDIGYVFTGENIGNGSGLFLSKNNDSSNNAYLTIKSLRPYSPVKIESQPDHLTIYMEGGGVETGKSHGNGAALFSRSTSNTFYFNTIHATGELTGYYSEDDDFLVIDTMPEEFKVIDSSPYYLKFDTQKTYVVDSSVGQLDLRLKTDGFVHKNGRSVTVAVPETCTKLKLPQEGWERMTPNVFRRGDWNYVHLYYTSGATSSGRTSMNSLINNNKFGMSFEDYGSADLPSLSLFLGEDGQGQEATDADIYYKLLNSELDPNIDFLKYSQEVNPLILYSIYQ